jgi:outer membrane protein assembly factor BamB
MRRAIMYKTNNMHRRIGHWMMVLLFVLGLSGCRVSAQKEYSWPCFHGSDRTNKSSETGLLKEWPGEGPRLKWIATGLGEGYSTVSVADGFIYVAGMHNGQTEVYCLDLEGDPVWIKPNGKAWSTMAPHARSYTGARSTPTWDEGVVYHVGETGRLAAFEAKTGEERWFRELKEDFETPDTEYGYSESVLIEGDKLYVRPAGPKGYQVCLNKHNGELIWANTEIPGVEGYSSPVMMECCGYQQLINASSDCYYGVCRETGELLWKVDYRNRQGLNITDAVVFNDYVFISSGYGKGSMLINLQASGEEVIPQTVWHTEQMDNHHGGVILHDGYLYGSGSNAKYWFCLDFRSGEPVWQTRGKGSITYADGMLYLLDERGSLKLAEAAPGEVKITGEIQVPEGGPGMFWAHPVVCNGTLYIRHANTLYAYDIKEE